MLLVLLVVVVGFSVRFYCVNKVQSVAVEIPDEYVTNMQYRVASGTNKVQTLQLSIHLY